MLIVVLLVVIVLGATLFYSIMLASTNHSTTSSSSSSSTQQSTIQGIVAGYVTVGPSQPTCSANQSSCTEDLSGYSLEFTSQCGTTSGASSSASCRELTYGAQIAPSGHYSILLSPGNYTITGLSPSCSWVGCSSAFPESVAVESGQQLVVNVNIDTGIR
jgi:hypothetical protein